ncbi:MAG: hypothetical protein O7E52_23825, partial [Candidatus Poribacteria bacterium]|nr:hypothetical protein [Candidatus Poribacteria bacterium]
QLHPRVFFDSAAILGVTCPDTSLNLARCKRDDARTLLAQNIDPSTCRREEKAALTNTLSVVAD